MGEATPQKKTKKTMIEYRTVTGNEIVTGNEREIVTLT
jgi:hypothetical protein